jgi:hypothetical protein
MGLFAVLLVNNIRGTACRCTSGLVQTEGLSSLVQSGERINSGYIRPLISLHRDN